MADPVAARLDDPDEQVRAAAVRAVARLPGGAFTERLEALTDDPSLAVRAAVAVALDDLDGGARGLVAAQLG